MSILPMNMRDKIADVIDFTCHNDPYAQADAIIAALPEMIPDLVWENKGGRFHSGKYIIAAFESGLYVEFMLLGLHCPKSLEEVIAAANAHHRASIMAAFTGETT
jgi:hypothetical protein